MDASTAAEVIIPGMDLMEEIASDEVLGLAYDWLCERREGLLSQQRCLGRPLAME